MFEFHIHIIFNQFVFNINRQHNGYPYLQVITNDLHQGNTKPNHRKKICIKKSFFCAAYSVYKNRTSLILFMSTYLKTKNKKTVKNNNTKKKCLVPLLLLSLSLVYHFQIYPNMEWEKNGTVFLLLSDCLLLATREQITPVEKIHFPHRKADAFR